MHVLLNTSRGVPCVRGGENKATRSHKQRGVARPPSDRLTCSTCQRTDSAGGDEMKAANTAAPDKRIDLSLFSK